ncbi:MAG: hypothetical protein ACOCWD_01800, partial [Tangfeifania sp.]
TGFGMDGQNGARELDFTQVRGEFEKNETVNAIREHMKKKEAMGDEVIERMWQIQATAHSKKEAEVAGNLKGSKN